MRINFQEKDDSYLLLIVEESASRIGFYDPVRGRCIASIETGFLPHEIEVSGDGKTAYVSNFGLQDYDETIGVAGCSVSILDLELMCERGRLYTVDETGEIYKGPHGLKLRPESSELFVNVEQGDRILVFELATQKLKRQVAGIGPLRDPNCETTFKDPKGTHNFVFSLDGSALFLFAGPKGVFKMNPDTGEMTAHYPSRTPIHGLSFLPGGQSLIASGVNELILLDPVDLSVQKVFGSLNVQQILYSVATLDGERIIAPACWDSQVLVIDACDGRVLERIVTGIDPVHVQISPGGESAWITNARSCYVSRIDLQTYRQTRIETAEGPNGIGACPRYAKTPRKQLCFGCVLPFSGALSQSGRELAAGYQYWAEKVNSAGGLAVGDEVYEISLALRDNGSDTRRTAALTAELLKDAGAGFMFGGYPTPSDEAAGRLVNELRVPMVTSACAGGSIYTSSNHYVFGILSPASGYLRGTIDVVRRLSPPPETFCMLSSDDPAAMEDASINTAYAKSQGMEIVFASSELPEGISVTAKGVVLYCEGMTEFIPILRLLAGLKPAMFFSTGHAPATLAIVQQAASIDFAPAGFSFAVGVGTPAVVHALGPLAANLFGPAQWIPQLTTFGFDRFGTAGQFASGYYQRYNMAASYLSAGAVACGLTFEDAIQRAGTIEREAVREALADTHLSTFYGAIEFNSSGINEKKPLITVQLQQSPDGLNAAVLAPDFIAGSAKAIWPFPGWPKQDK